MEIEATVEPDEEDADEAVEYRGRVVMPAWVAPAATYDADSDTGVPIVDKDELPYCTPSGCELPWNTGGAGEADVVAVDSTCANGVERTDWKAEVPLTGVTSFSLVG